jgi:hypothetical protein
MMLLLPTCAGDDRSPTTSIPPAVPSTRLTPSFAEPTGDAEHAAGAESPGAADSTAEASLDLQAKSDAHFATAAALAAMFDGGPDAVTPDVLAAIEPSLTFVDGAARKPGEASVYAGRSGALGVAVMSGSGTCFWIMNPAKGEQRYGSGMPCSGRAALLASQADW